MLISSETPVVSLPAGAYLAGLSACDRIGTVQLVADGRLLLDLGVSPVRTFTRHRVVHPGGALALVTISRIYGRKPPIVSVELEKEI